MVTNNNLRSFYVKVPIGNSTDPDQQDFFAGSVLATNKWAAHDMVRAAAIQQGYLHSNVDTRFTAIIREKAIQPKVPVSV